LIKTILKLCVDVEGPKFISPTKAKGYDQSVVRGICKQKCNMMIPLLYWTLACGFLQWPWRTTHTEGVIFTLSEMKCETHERSTFTMLFLQSPTRHKN